jgi:WD40 repeat protein
VYVVGVSTGAARQMQGKHTGRVWGMVFSGDSLASFGDDATVLIRDARSGQRLLSLAGHTGRILGAAFSADGGELWTSALDRSVIAWDLTGRRSLGVTSSTRPTGPFPDAQGALHVAWSRDRTRAVAVWSDGLAAALDTTTGAIGPGDRFPGRIGDVALSPDGARAFLTVMDPATLRTVVQRWDVARRRSDGSVDPGPDFIEGSLDLSPDGRVLAVGTFDDEVFKRRTPLYLVDPGTLQTLGAPLDVLPSPLVAFSPDGRSLAVASATAAGIAVLDVPTRRVRWLDRSVSQAHVVAFSPDGTRLGVGSEQGVVAVYDAASGARVAGPAQVQPGIVTTTTFSPDSRRLLTAGADGLVRLWQPADLRPLATSLFTPDNVGRNATFSPDGSSILVVDHTGRFTSWDARPQAWLRRACSIADRDFTSEERARYAITADSPQPCP